MNESKAAIYHFTDGGSIRPIVYEKEINRIKRFATDIGFTDIDLYLDIKQIYSFFIVFPNAVEAYRFSVLSVL